MAGDAMLDGTRAGEKLEQTQLSRPAIFMVFAIYFFFHPSYSVFLLPFSLTFLFYPA
jgi:hypothetical protein